MPIVSPQHDVRQSEFRDGAHGPFRFHWLALISFLLSGSLSSGLHHSDSEELQMQLSMNSRGGE
jgi:hypothetical protein